MNKKIFLTLSFLSILGTTTQSYSSYDDNNGAKIAAMAGASVVAGGTIVYWVGIRENNEVKMNRVYTLASFYASNLHHEILKIETIADVVKFVSQSARFKKEVMVFSDMVENSYYEMNARYGSWLKPWNWSKSMKEAYQKITVLRQKMKLVMIMYRYQQLLVELETSPLVESSVISKAKMVCQGMSVYPLCSCVDMMQEDIKFLYKNSLIINCDVALIEALEKFVTMIRGSNEYVEEKRIQEAMELKRREVEAEERKAQAQRDQAWAQQSQADATRERNRIEREKEEQRKKEKEEENRRRRDE